jgi:hypothetical protein
MRSISSLVVAPVAAARVAAVCRRSWTRNPSNPTFRTAGSHTSRRKLLRARCFPRALRNTSPSGPGAA